MSEREPLRDSKTTLYEAAKTAIAEQQAKADSARARQLTPERRRWVLFRAAVAAAGAVLLVLQPSWLAGPRTIPPEPAAIATVSVRLTLLRERDRVVDFQRRNGRLPSTLAEAGITMAGLLYHVDTAGGFQLTGFAGDSVIVIGPSETPAVFLGRGLNSIRDRGQE